MKLHTYTRTAPRITRLKLSGQAAKAKRNERHGLYALLGPPGCGKSVLAVHLARGYARQRRMSCDCGEVGCPYTEPCLCGDWSCQVTEWQVLSNIPSTYTGQNPKGIAWAQRLDVIETLMDRASELSHAIIILDEAYEYADARRSQSKVNVEAGKFVSQRRKLGGGVTKVILTAQSFDMLDSRIRGQTSRAFDCWTPNEGVSVGAVVHDMAIGHIPPWARRRQRPRIKIYDTRHDRLWYDTHDQIHAEELAYRGKDLKVFIRDSEGKKKLWYLSELIDQTLWELYEEDQPFVTAEEIAETIQTDYNFPVPARRVRDQLFEHGFPYTNTEDGQLAFHLVVDQTNEEGAA